MTSKNNPVLKGPVRVETEDDVKRLIEKRDDLHRAYDSLYLETASRIFAGGFSIDGDPKSETDYDAVTVMAKKALHYACAFMDELEDRTDRLAIPTAEKHVCTSECNSEKEQKLQSAAEIAQSAVEIVQLLMPGAGKMLEGGPFVFDHYEIKRSVLRPAFIDFRALLYFKDGPFGRADNVIMMEGKIIEKRGHHLINTYNTSTFLPVDHLAAQLEAAG